MGVPYYPQPPQQVYNGEAYNAYYNSDTFKYYPNYYPPPSSENYQTSNPSPESSDILSEYISNGLTSAFINKYQRQLTIVASSLSVIILIVIGTCLWCLLGIVKKGLDKKSDTSSDSSQHGAAEETFSGGSSSTPKKSGGGSNDLESSSSDGSGGAHSKRQKVEPGSSACGTSGAKWYGGGKKRISLISKIFSKQNGNSARILAQHRNIITPDKTIPFVVPTIQLPAQPSASPGPSNSSLLFPDDRHLHSPLSTSPLDPQPSTSSAKSVSAKHQALLLAQQFFPQLEHPESDSCPLVAFSLYYELSSQILNVRLLEGRNFPDTLVHTVAVKIYPGRGSKQHTKEFKSRSPVYNQEFCFHVRKGSLHTKILKLRAVIPGSPKRVIGYVNMAIKDLPGFDKSVSVDDGAEEDQILEDLKTPQLWRRVELPSEGGDGVKLQMSLKWSPEPGPGLLTLKIIEASGLHENRDCDYTSSYVKVTLQEQGRNIKTRKTQLVRWGSVPLFDDVFVLTIPRELLQQISFLLVVMARGRLGSKAVLGKICIGPVPYALTSSSGGISTARPSTAASSSSCSSSGIEFWEDMCHQPDSEIVRWLHLLP